MTSKVCIGVIVSLALLLGVTTGCIWDTLPNWQGIPVSVKHVEACGQPATMFTSIASRATPSKASAIVPRIGITNQDRLAIYDNADGTLLVVINGQDKTVEAKLYRLGVTGVSVRDGWHWQHNLVALERQMGCGDQ